MKDFVGLSIFSQVTYIFQQLAILIAFIGLVGNIFSFLILSRKSMKKHSFAFYVRLMNAVDLIPVLTQFRHWLAFTVDFNLATVSDLLCKLADVYTLLQTHHFSCCH